MLYFIESWNSDKKNTWSGTPWHLMRSISNLAYMEERDIKLSFFEKVAKKFCRACCKVFSINDAGVLDLIQGVHHINSFDILADEEPSLVFGDFRSNHIADTYIYIDCSVDFIYRNINSGKIYSKFLPCSKKTLFSLLNLRQRNALEFYESCKGIFTMGQWIADDLIENTGLPAYKVHCVGGGINIDQNLVDISKKRGRRFLFVGKDFDRKNGSLVVDAFIKLNATHGNKYELYIAGPQEWPLKNGIPDSIHFLGLQTSDELIKYYNLCDVFVMPSIFEAYGLVYAEALVFGLPIIARDAFAMKDFVQPGVNGYLLKSYSVDELSHLMYLAISDKEMSRRVISKRKEYAERYSWDTVAKRMVDVMRNDGYEV